MKLGEIVERTKFVHFQCSRCSRSGRYRAAGLAMQYGRDTEQKVVMDDLAEDCPNRSSNPDIPMTRWCSVYCPDLPGIVGRGLVTRFPLISTLPLSLMHK
jgi:hypothetical protein